MGRIVCGSPLKALRRSSINLDDKIAGIVEARMGKIPFSGRYHRQRALADDYEVSQSVLGTGLNGEVRMATSITQPDLKFAVKSLQLSNLTKDKRELLEAEVENYLSMDHPHITRLCDVYESDHQLHMVMECLEGGEVFDRLTTQKRFSEEEASDALRQMLLALNYIHSHGIVHRDIKLENFVYDKKGSRHLKLIDFGFSKMWKPSGQKPMQASLGTLAYVAPEVIDKKYTSQCDLWSLGVIGFILLSGYMPFSGPETVMIRNIRKGTFEFRPERWSTVSDEAKDFIFKLLEVNPSKRLTAQTALEHPWIVKSCTAAMPQDVDIEVVEALKKFGRVSKFRRCCMEMLAWSLSNEERAKVRNSFLTLDADHSGGITLRELEHVMIDKLHAADKLETMHVFEALDYNHDQEIHYSDFLAAMVDSQINLNEQHLNAVFRRFDADHTGYISLENLREVLGSRVDGEKVEVFMKDVNESNNGRITLSELSSYLQREDFELPSGDAEVDAHSLPSTGTVQSKQMVKPLKRMRSFRNALACFCGQVF
jgi:calcium-dependent protein kinase